jgi:hypothetical protein
MSEGGSVPVSAEEAYEGLMNQLPADEVVVFADAVHPTHAVPRFGQLG